MTSTMTLAVTHTDAPLGAIIAFRVVNSILNFKEASVAWNEDRVTRNMLRELSDKQLDDIGLKRSDLR